MAQRDDRGVRLGTHAALDEQITDHVSTAKALLKQMTGHVLARGVVTGTYERQ